MYINPKILYWADKFTAKSALGVKDLTMFNICIDKDRIVATNGSILFIERLPDFFGAKVMFKMDKSLALFLSKAEGGVDVSRDSGVLFFVDLTTGECLTVPIEEGNFIEYERVIETGEGSGVVGVFSPKLYASINDALAGLYGPNYTLTGFADGVLNLHLIEVGTTSVFLCPWKARTSFGSSEIAKAEVLRC